TLMKSRRRISFTKAGTTPNRTRLQQGFAIDEMGYEARLHGSNPEPPMSALGQKQTWKLVRVMSALPPKADMDQQGRDVRFVPIADISLIQSPRRHEQEPLGKVRPSAFAALKLTDSAYFVAA